MKKILLILFGLLFGCVQVFAGTTVVVGQPAAATGSAWDIEIYFEGTTDGTTYTAGGDDSGFSTATMSESGLVDTSNDNVTLDAASEYVAISTTVDGSEGAIEIRMKPATGTGTTYFLEAYTDSNNRFEAFIQSVAGVERAGMDWRGNGSTVVDTFGATGEGSYCRIRYKWKDGDLYCQVDDGDDGTYDSWSSATSITSLTSDPASFQVGYGYYGANGRSIEVDYVKLSDDSTIFD